jgi:vacuolar-type H+-ATPase subunit E/Vma4
MNAYAYVYKIGYEEAKRILSSVRMEVESIESEGYRYRLEDVRSAVKDFEIMGTSYWASIPDYIAVKYQNMMTRDYLEVVERVNIALDRLEAGTSNYNSWKNKLTAKQNKSLIF